MADVGSLNLVVLVGRVTGEVKFDRGKGIDKNVTFARFSLATNEVFKGSKQTVQFHNLVAFGPKAELVNKWCSKGKLILVKGKLRQNRWTDKEGNKRSNTQVNIDEITFLGKKDDYANGPKKDEKPTQKSEEKNDPF